MRSFRCNCVQVFVTVGFKNRKKIAGLFWGYVYNNSDAFHKPQCSGNNGPRPVGDSESKTEEAIMTIHLRFVTEYQTLIN